MKILILIFLIPFFQSCSKSSDVRGYTIIDDMVHSPAYEAFSENSLTPDGKTMMMPVKGSIARGKMPHPYSDSEADALKAAEELQDPYPETAASLRRGEYLYKGFCISCHGETGEGDGPITSKKFPAPPSFKSSRVKSFNKARIYHVITAGFGSMPAHGSQLTIQDRWYLAQYVKKFQK